MKKKRFSIYLTYFMALISLIYLGMLIVNGIWSLFDENKSLRLFEYLTVFIWTGLASLAMFLNNKFRQNRQKGGKDD